MLRAIFLLRTKSKFVSKGKSGVVSLLQEFSIPLIAGVLCALFLANADESSYHSFIEYGPFDGFCADREPGTFCMSPGGHGEAHAEGDSHADADAHADDAHAEGDDHADDGHAEEVAAAVAAATEDGASAATLGDAAVEHGTMTSVFGIFGHHMSLHFMINDIFMLFFFGIAAKEITESILPGGALNPPSKAVNPLLGTLGGVFGPIAVYFLLATLFFGDADAATKAEVFGGWGIPTATDIALAWLVARMVFGGTHPAVNFLLLLAIADDAIGLGIIAVFYPNPDHPPAPVWLLLVLVGMTVAYFLRKRGVKSWLPYIFIGGLISWLGLLKASLHPALALVPIVPFLPGPDHDSGLFTGDDESAHAAHDDSTLHNFEHDLKLFVDFGLFFFGLTNAGVAFASVNSVTWVVLGALLVGKTIGVFGFSAIGNALGFKYPEGMSGRHVLVAGVIAGMGLTVALFVAGEAFPGESVFQGPAKMGALGSAAAALLAFGLGRILKVSELEK